MKIYVTHSTNFDYQAELYAPLKQVFGDSHELILPHDNKDGEDSKATIKSSDLVLAVVSYPSTGQGIELDWADEAGIPIVCLHASGTKPSGALLHIARSVTIYSDKDSLMRELAKLVAQY